MSTRPQIIVDADAKEKGERFLGTPERWLDNPKFRCENGHVSKTVLRSEKLKRQACLACEARIWLTFP
jgi:hypothetical protein